MADNTDISQLITESAPDAGSAQISQAVSEAGGDASAAQISQDIAEAGANASAAQISQAMWESAPNHAEVIISQLTIELSYGELVAPPAPLSTVRFDAGQGSIYYLVPQLSDSGLELRDKVIKAVRITGKFNAANFKLYAYGATEGINLADIELGTNSRTGAVAIPDTALVTQTRRFQVNVTRAALHTIRIEGQWDGTGMKDRIDEIEYELAEQGVRR